MHCQGILNKVSTCKLKQLLVESFIILILIHNSIYQTGLSCRVNTKERGALRWRQLIALVDSSDIEHKYEADRTT
jgi:hypothetical protein